MDSVAAVYNATKQGYEPYFLHIEAVLVSG